MQTITKSAVISSPFTLKSGTIRMKTPPFAYVDGTQYSKPSISARTKIKTFVYARSWLINILRYPLFS